MNARILDNFLIKIVQKKILKYNRIRKGDYMDIRKVTIRPIKYEDKIEIPHEYYKNTGVLEIKNVTIEFEIKKNNNQEDILFLKSEGIFILEDARTLNPVEDPFCIEFETILNEESEFCGRFLTNSQNTLDILDILWENIVLEIPISFTVSEELKETQNSCGEDCKKMDPRMAPLMDLLDKEKE